MNGITTISQRARYFLLLPWALGEFFKNETFAGEAEFDWENLTRFLRRVEFVIMSATRLDQTIDDGTGLLGPDVYREELKMFLDGEATEFPTEKGGAMIGTYFRPCAALGLLADGAPGSGVPIRLTPRGKNIWEIKQSALQGSAVLAAIREGARLHRSAVEPVISEFSLGALQNSTAEVRALTEALFVPWKTGNEAEDKIVADAYQRFASTRQWLTRSINGNPSWSPNTLAINYRACATSHDRDDTALAWAEYEFLRRCHFALELLLAALTDQLAISGDASIAEIVASWASTVPNSASRFWPAAASAWKGTTEAAKATVSIGLFFEEPLSIDKLRDQSPADRALTSFALLCALMKQSHELRRHSKFGEHGRASENPIKIIEAAGSEQFTNLMRKLLEACVVALTSRPRCAKWGQAKNVLFGFSLTVPGSVLPASKCLLARAVTVSQTSFAFSRTSAFSGAWTTVTSWTRRVSDNEYSRLGDGEGPISNNSRSAHAQYRFSLHPIHSPAPPPANRSSTAHDLRRRRLRSCNLRPAACIT